jgi:hypothetical protein
MDEDLIAAIDKSIFWWSPTGEWIDGLQVMCEAMASVEHRIRWTEELPDVIAFHDYMLHHSPHSPYVKRERGKQ